MFPFQDLAEHQRGDAVSSMVYEANARLRDPVYGCVGVISSLQHQVAQLQTQLALAHAEIVRLRVCAPQANGPELQSQEQLLSQYEQKPTTLFVSQEGLHQNMGSQGPLWTN
ncbi:hypothetical protein L7F22_044756 [Adiantum nelumboides]|nr:hypothetical protein [Adiantum nelumboides]